MTFDLYFILEGFGLACLAWAPLYLYFNLIMAMAELDSEEKEKSK